MICGKCSSTSIVLDGFIKSKQRYKCKSCSFHFTLHPPLGKSSELKRLALHLYLEGLGYRSIGRVLGVSNVAVLKWIKPIEKFIQPLLTKDRQIENTEVLGLEELHKYLTNKKKLDGSSWFLIKLPNKLPSNKVVITQSSR